MKNLRVEIEQLASNDNKIIYDTNAKIFVNDKEIENNVEKVVDALIDKDDNVKYKVSKYQNLYIDVEFKSGQTIEYKLEFNNEDEDNRLIIPTSDIETIKEFLKKIKDFILNVEEEIADARSTRKHYTIEL